MAGRLYNLDLVGLAHTYDSGGQLPFPGVMIGNETANLGLAPDNDAKDLGIDVFANYQNGTGPQYDGQGKGVYVDLDTNSGHPGSTFIGGVDDNDPGSTSDVAVLGHGGQLPDEGFLAVHLSGTGDQSVNGLGQPIEQPPAELEPVSHTVLGLGAVDFDHS